MRSEGPGAKWAFEISPWEFLSQGAESRSPTSRISERGARTQAGFRRCVAMRSPRSVAAQRMASWVSQSPSAGFEVAHLGGRWERRRAVPSDKNATPNFLGCASGILERTF